MRGRIYAGAALALLALGQAACGDGTADAKTKDLDLTQLKVANDNVRTTGARRARKITGNGLPTNHTTGTYPIAQDDDVYQYDRNPNTIRAQSLSYRLPASPRKASSPQCITGGAVGVLDSGVALYHAVDATGRDAAANEVQDSCDGHPQISGVYHYHALPRCLETGSSKAHSKRIGWALDGFPIYGPRGDGGEYMRNSKLDACHGHTHAVKVDGRRRAMYHYHATMEFPYTVGCFRGEQAETGDEGGAPGGGMPGGGPPPMG